MVAHPSNVPLQDGTLKREGTVWDKLKSTPHSVCMVWEQDIELQTEGSRFSLRGEQQHAKLYLNQEEKELYKEFRGLYALDCPMCIFKNWVK